MKPNLRTIRCIMQLKITIHTQYISIHLSVLILRKNSLIVTRTLDAAIIWHDKDPDIQNNYWGLKVSIWAIMLYSRVNSKSLEIGSRHLDRPIFKLTLWKNPLELQKFQQICSVARIYLGKRCVHFMELLFLKCNEKWCFLKIK